MKITELTPQKKNPNRFNLYVDDKFYCGVSLDVVAKHNLYKSKEVEDTVLSMILYDSLVEKLNFRVTVYLSRYRKTEKEARQYISELLYKKQGDWFAKDLKINKNEIVEKITDFALENKLLDDYQFAVDYISDRTENKPRSKYLIQLELRRKGVSEQIISEAFKTQELLISDEELIVKLCKKKYGVEKISMDDKKKISFFQRKGFSWDIIGGIID